MNVFKRNISEKLRMKLKEETKKLPIVTFNLKSKNVTNHFKSLENLHKNFRIKNNSQVYLDENGDCVTNFNALNGLTNKEMKRKLEELTNEGVQIGLNEEKIKGMKKFNFLNQNKNIGSVITIQVHNDQLSEGIIKKGYNEIHDDMGQVYDSLEKNKDLFEVIQLQDGTNSTIIEGDSYHFGRLMQFINIIQSEGTLSDKLISIKTQSVRIH